MTDEKPADAKPAPDTPQFSPVKRKKLDAVFGDVLPDITEDERRDGSSGFNDQWYQENRPPHHG